MATPPPALARARALVRALVQAQAQVRVAAPAPAQVLAPVRVRALAQVPVPVPAQVPASAPAGASAAVPVPARARARVPARAEVEAVVDRNRFRDQLADRIGQWVLFDDRGRLQAQFKTGEAFNINEIDGYGWQVTCVELDRRRSETTPHAMSIAMAEERNCDCGAHTAISYLDPSVRQVPILRKPAPLIAPMIRMIVP